MTNRRRAIKPLLAAGALVGCGLGALFDGIVFHHVLQWHNMLSSVHPPVDLPWMKYNMLWDGVFDAAGGLITAIGIAQLVIAGDKDGARWSRTAVVGGGLAGWGFFNVVEGLVNHHWLGLHHVHPGELQPAWDFAFLAWGAAMLVVGVLLGRRDVKGHDEQVASDGPG